MVENNGGKKGEVDNLIPLPWAENVLVTLGYSAILINAVFLLLYLVMFIAGKAKHIQQWIVISSIGLFIFQLVYFFTNIFK